jgi:hypothetical protein
MEMRYAYMLMGLSTIILSVGAFFAFSNKASAPAHVTPSNQENMLFTLSTPAFKEGESIPSKYTCDGDNVSPEFSFENVPEGTESFALLMDDPDIPDSVKQARGIEIFDHWVLYNIPGTARGLKEGGNSLGMLDSTHGGQRGMSVLVHLIGSIGISLDSTHSAVRSISSRHRHSAKWRRQYRECLLEKRHSWVGTSECKNQNNIFL